MKGFFKVQTPDQILAQLGRFTPLAAEAIPLETSLGRVLAEDVLSPIDLPEFTRSTVDGFAVKARDTYGASERNPSLLAVSGEVRMGRRPDRPIRDGEAMKVPTGGALPEGADAVEMIEHAEWVDERTLHAFKALSPLENVIRQGEDVKAGETVLRRGRRVRPQDMGLLAGIGRTVLSVVRRPRVGILSSGDEIIPVETAPAPGEVRDANRYTIGGLVEESGGIPVFLGIAKDRFDDLRERVETGLRETDMVVVTGGSSVGTLDLTQEVLQSFARADVLAHGVSVRPGKPTLLAEVEGKPFLGLPGHPVSAMVIFTLFGKPLLRVLSGLSEDPGWQARRVRARAGRNIPSGAGREDYVRVRIEERDGVLTAHPLFGKSGALSHLVRADGLLRIDLNEEGIEEGEEGEVILL
jgi:molybdopterin molybdotransferase